MRRAAGVLAVVIGLALAGCSQEAPSTTPRVLAAPAASAVSPPPAPTTRSRPSPAPTPAGPSISIAAIGASSTLVPLGLNPDRTVQVPPVSRPEQAGVYTKGPVPGDPGPALILGHVNGAGRPGVFARLSQLAAGDQITVTRPDRKVATFRVDRTRTVEKDAFPTAEVYSDTVGPELRLVTCGGELDQTARSYRSNVIVFASLVGTR